MAVEVLLELTEEEHGDGNEEDDGDGDAAQPRDTLTRQVTPLVVPKLLQLLATVSDEGDTDHEYNRASAAGVALQRFAAAAPATAVPVVLGFAAAHLASADWKQRHAACMALGACASSPDERSQAVVMEVLPRLLEVVSHDDDSPNHTVASSAGWAIGERIVRLIPARARA